MFPPLLSSMCAHRSLWVRLTAAQCGAQSLEHQTEIPLAVALVNVVRERELAGCVELVRSNRNPERHGDVGGREHGVHAA